LSWSLIEPGELDAGLRLAAALTRFWFLHGYASEGSEWLEALLARAPISPARIEALSASGFLLVRRGAPDAAHRLLDEAVALARQLSDRCLLAKALNHLGELRVQEGDLTGARSALEESLALTAEATADWPVYWPKYLILDNLGELAEAEGDTVAASTFYELSLKLASAQQDGWRWVVLRRLGQWHIDRGELVAARDRLTQALVTARDWGKAGWGVPPVLVGLANLAMAEDRPSRALRLAGAAIGLREEHQARLQPTHAARLEAVTALGRGALGETRAQKAWEEGRAMRLDEAVAYALEGVTSEPVTGALGGLTPREKDVATAKLPAGC
jgi:non-specific serine/threonine protein kinase